MNEELVRIIEENLAIFNYEKRLNTKKYVLLLEVFATMVVVMSVHCRR